MCAAQALGAVPVPVYADAVADEMAYVLAHAEVTLAVVEDQEQVDKILSDRRSPAPAAQHHLRRAARAAATTTTPGCSPSRDVQDDRPRDARDRRRRALARWEARIAAGKGARPRRHPLHLGHHRPAQGRDADAIDNIIVSARNGNALRPARRERGGASPICRWPGSAITSSPTRSPMWPAIASTARRRPETVVRGPPRDRHHLLLRAAARLREPADPDDGAHGGCRRAQAPDVPLFHRRRAALAASRSSTASRCRLGAGCSTGSASCWSMAR